MIRLGQNLKITTHTEHRGRIRELLEGVLGLPLTTSGAFDRYAIGDGSIGYFFVDEPVAALSFDDARKGAWIELLVDDPAATRDALAARGLEPFVFSDAAHTYFALPGGQVFRLGRAG